MFSLLFVAEFAGKDNIVSASFVFNLKGAVLDEIIDACLQLLVVLVFQLELMFLT